MADISKCLNKECPLKHKCYRWTAPWGEPQAVMDFKPDENGECKDFYDRN